MFDLRFLIVIRPTQRAMCRSPLNVAVLVDDLTLLKVAIVLSPTSAHMGQFRHIAERGVACSSSLHESRDEPETRDTESRGGKVVWVAV